MSNWPLVTKSARQAVAIGFLAVGAAAVLLLSTRFGIGVSADGTAYLGFRSHDVGHAPLYSGLMRLLRVEYEVAAPGALIGASNFFELAVATAIALYGPGSGAALATVVGVLVEVPVMLSVCRVCVATRHWFPRPALR